MQHKAGTGSAVFVENASLQQHPKGRVYLEENTWSELEDISTASVLFDGGTAYGWEPPTWRKSTHPKTLETLVNDREEAPSAAAAPAVPAVQESPASSELVPVGQRVSYIRVGGRWCYLYRAITAGGQTLDFYLSPKRNVAAAKRFLAKALRSNASAGYPRVINTDKAPSLARAIAELKSEGICPPTVEHRQVKYLNNILEGDHGRLKRIPGPRGAFKNRTSA